MSSPSSCLRCSRPLEILSATGLCPECLRTDHAPLSTRKDPLDPTPAVDPFLSTRSDRGEPDADRADIDLNALAVTDRVPKPVPGADPTGKPRAPLPPSPPGFELLTELGAGGMGVVYLAREQVPDRLVAMKFLQRPGSQAAFDRFLVEVRALAAVDHPHIIGVLSSDFLRADPYFTTEYIPGGSLSKQVEKDGPFEPTAAARLIATAARAVQAAHRARVIHRDLKPSNILLAADGSPRISDFGLAKRLDRDDGLTTSGPLGTPRYMAPEQTGRRDAVVDARTDVYGLGATLYHALTGQAPFAGGSQDEALRQVQNDFPTPPRWLRPEIPRELEAITLKCLEKDPARRYPTAQAFAADLERFLAGQAPDAPLLTWPRRMAQRVRRHRRSLAAVALAAVAVLALGAILRPDPARLPDAPELPDWAGWMQHELAAGREVIPIGLTGKPLWHRWAVGSPEIALSPTGDGTCSFEAVNRSAMELCADPMKDRYRFGADIRIVHSRLPLDAAPDGRTPGIATGGVYFAYSFTPGNAPAAAHAMFQITFSDNPRPPAPNGKVSDNAVSLRRFIMLQNPGGIAPSHKSGLANLEFQPAANLPGPWRRIEVEVTPEKVRAWWREPDGTMKSIADLSAGQIRAEYAGLPQKLTQAPNHGVTLPQWHPRMPLGIWNESAAIDVRNFTITPIP
jgi:hypothetical protein